MSDRDEPTASRPGGAPRPGGDRPRPRPRPGPGRPSVATPAAASRQEVPAAEEATLDLLDADDLTAAGTTGGGPQPTATDTVADTTPPDPKSDTEADDVSPAGTASAPASDDAPRGRRLGRRGARHAAPEPERAGADLTKYLATPVATTDEETDDEEPDDGGAKGRSRAPGSFRVRHRRSISFATRTLAVLLVAAVVAVLLRAFVVEPYYIPSESMEPTLHGCAGCTDDHVLVDKISYRFQSVHAGDIVVFDKPPNANVTDKVLIKRVIALSGDTVQLRRNSAGQWDGKVYVNGLALDESYVNKACPAPQTVPLTGTTSWKIPDKEVFVMGDNRCRSDDSRAFGPIKTSSVIGRAVLIVWPLSRFGGI